MASTPVYTVSDVVDSLTDWSGGGTSTDATQLRRIRRSIEAAYREVSQARNWSYLYGRGRLDTVASYSTGTIAYTNSTRAVTLTTGTWPTWAANGTLQISGIEYEIASRDSSSQITLSVNSNPGEDVAAGTSYTIWKDTYVLPVNFTELGTIKDASNNVTLQYVEANDFVALRIANMAASEPRYFVLTGDQNYIGAMAIKLFPPPGSIYHYDYMYRRMPRQFTMPSYTTGTVTTSTTTVTGTSTVFTQAMIGCVIRFGSATTAPTGTHGASPYVAQRVITSFTSATSIGIDQALSAELTAVKFEISDPIEIEANSTYTAFLRRCEYELALAQRRDDADMLLGLANRALRVAFEQDDRSFDRRPEGTGGWRRVPLYYDITNVTS